jgi:hypothetical protein
MDMLVIKGRWHSSSRGSGRKPPVLRTSQCMPGAPKLLHSMLAELRRSGRCQCHSSSLRRRRGGMGVSRNRTRSQAKPRTKSKIKRGKRRSSWPPSLFKYSRRSVKDVAVDSGAISNNGREGNLNVVKTTPPTQSPCTQHQVSSLV